MKNLISQNLNIQISELALAAVAENIEQSINKTRQIAITDPNSNIANDIKELHDKLLYAITGNNAGIKGKKNPSQHRGK